MTYEYFEDSTPAANCSSKLHADVHESTASDRVRLLSESQTFAALGSEDKRVREAAEQRLQRSHIKYQPSDLIDRAIERPDDAENYVKGLSGFYGMSQNLQSLNLQYRKPRSVSFFEEAYENGEAFGEQMHLQRRAPAEPKIAGLITQR